MNYSFSLLRRLVIISTLRVKNLEEFSNLREKEKKKTVDLQNRKFSSKITLNLLLDFFTITKVKTEVHLLLECNHYSRFARDPNLENANVNAMVHPSFNMTFQNQGFRDNSTFASRENSTFISQAPSEQWNGSNNNIAPSR